MKIMFWCRVFTTKDNTLVAICDEEILDKEIKNENFDLKISKNFYGENLVEEKVALKLLRKATIGNLTGKNIVELAGKNGFIAKENIIFIDGIPHAQFVKIQI